MYDFISRFELDIFVGCFHITTNFNQGNIEARSHKHADLVVNLC